METLILGLYRDNGKQKGLGFRLLGVLGGLGFWGF